MAGFRINDCWPPFCYASALTNHSLIDRQRAKKPSFIFSHKLFSVIYSFNTIMQYFLFMPAYFIWADIHWILIIHAYAAPAPKFPFGTIRYDTFLKKSRQTENVSWTGWSISCTRYASRWRKQSSDRSKSWRDRWIWPKLFNAARRKILQGSAAHDLICIPYSYSLAAFRSLVTFLVVSADRW